MNRISEAWKSLDVADDQLLTALSERMAVVERIGQLRRGNVMPVIDPDREREIHARTMERASELGLNPHYVNEIFRLIVAYSREAQQWQKFDDGSAAPVVTFQGVEGAYSWLAARKYFSTHCSKFELVGLPTFEEALDSVIKGDADYALLPMENSITGSLVEVYDLLARGKTCLIGEVNLPIESCLIGLKGACLADIRTVYSHPVALQQCNNFLNRHSDIQIEAYVDTADAARKVHLDGEIHQAAIASREAAELYGLSVIRESVSNIKANTTRFGVIALNPVPVDLHLPAKTSVVMQLASQPGTLTKILNMIGERGINLVKLESRPVPSDPTIHRTFMDLEGNVDHPVTKAAIDAIRPMVKSVRILGCYVDSTRIDVNGSPPSGDKSSGEEARTICDASGQPVPPEQGKVKAKASSRTKKSSGKSRLVDLADRDRTVVEIGPVRIGDGGFCLIAGPCAVENPDQLERAARAVKEAGGRILRGGVFKPRSSPYSFQGLGWEGLKLLQKASERYGLPIVTEVMAPEQVARVAEGAQMLQIGARNMQNFNLLREVGRIDRPVLLKRGMMASIEELLNAAEYIMAQGNNQIVLCERGIRTFETSTRWTLDLSAVPVLRQRTHLPVCVDPSHAAGRRELVAPLAKAAHAIGVDAIMLEIHPEPEKALCDGPQALTPEDLKALMEDLEGIHEEAAL